MQHIRYGGADLNLLFVLERVLARGSVSVAAGDLGLSQSATSRALQRLREALGDELVVRVGNDLIATDRARALVEPTIRALEAANQVFAPPPEFALSTATGALTLALGDELQGVLLPPLLAALRDRAPGIDLRTRRLAAESVDEGRRGMLDIAIAPDLSALPLIAGAVDTSELVSRPLYVRTWTVAASREGWPAPACGSASLPPIDLGTWLAADHAIVSYEGGGRGFVDELLAARGLHRRVVASVTSFPAALELVARSRVLAVVPSELVGPHTPALHGFATPIPLPALPMRLLWHPRTTTQPRHRALRALVTEVVVDTLSPNRSAPAGAELEGVRYPETADSRTGPRSGG